MRLVTWNVNSITARLDFTLDFLETRKPDVVCLQELKTTDDDFPRLAFAQVGYAAATHGQPQWNGVAVLVRKASGPAPEVLERGLPGQQAMGARLITVRALGLDVASVYVPNGKSTAHPDFQAKLAWLDALVAHVGAASRRDGAAVIAGDFNLVPGDLDTWDPKGHEGHIFHTAEERARWSRLLGLGYHDLLREKHPDLSVFSWWDYRGGAFHKKQGLRIDFVLGTKSVRDRVLEAGVDRDFRKKRNDLTPSDHAPVVIELADAS